MTGRGLWLSVLARAACSNSRLSPDDWYPVSVPVAAARRGAAVAIAVCAACPVRGECLELALRNWAIGQFGVWAALSRPNGESYAPGGSLSSPMCCPEIRLLDRWRRDRGRAEP